MLEQMRQCHMYVLSLCFLRNCLGFLEHKFFAYKILKLFQKDFFFPKKIKKWRKLSYEVGFPACSIVHNVTVFLSGLYMLLQ